MSNYNNLYTEEFNNLNRDCPLSEYPFPQFKRESYFCLNGNWKYKISKDFNSLNNCENNILVPYPIESYNSGVNKKLNKGNVLIYEKKFSLPEEFIKKNTFIHFLGVDQKYKIILNGIEFEEIAPLNLPTKINISEAIKKDNTLLVLVTDNLDYRYPLGKQSNNPKGIFYTPFSGIYFPVFIESVDDNYIENIKITTTMNSVTLNVETESPNFEVIIKSKNEIITSFTSTNKKVEYYFENPILWDLDNPHLYDLIIKTNTDTINSYFGLREISLIDGFIYLNKKKIFLNGVLDQGYFPEGIVTPSTYKSFDKDILTMKELGFNTLRKHIKIELPYFYYLCDKYGMLVIQDFMNCGKYHFFLDTALPTIGLQKKNDFFLNTNKLQRSNFIKCGHKLIDYLSNHPSIVCYTIFNEGWGQFNSKKVYKEFKDSYPKIIFDTASGWYRGAPSDLDSYHWYFKNIDKIQKVKGPIFISEFGALCYKYENHAYGNEHVFGYRYFNSLNEVEKEFVNLYEEKIIPYKDKLIGTIYTQLSDIEEEDNGLLTYDRKKLKINPEIIKKTLNKLN